MVVQEAGFWEQQRKRAREQHAYCLEPSRENSAFTTPTAVMQPHKLLFSVTIAQASVTLTQTTVSTVQTAVPNARKAVYCYSYNRAIEQMFSQLKF